MACHTPIHKAVIHAVLLLLLASTGFIACSKKAGNANARFLGTYQGTNCKDSLLPDLIVTAGKNGSQIIVNFTINSGSCATLIGVTGTVSGNNVTFPSQTFNDLCGSVTTLSGSGTLSGNTFAINISGLFSLTGYPATPNSNYCFTGTKQ
jgi:hypothetical protein